MRVFGNAIDGGEAARGGGVNDGAAIGRNRRRHLYAHRFGDLADCAGSCVHRINVVVENGIGILTAVGEEDDLSGGGTGAPGDRMLVEFSGGDGARRSAFGHLDDVDVRAAVVGKRGASLVEYARDDDGIGGCRRGLQRAGEGNPAPEEAGVAGECGEDVEPLGPRAGACEHVRERVVTFALRDRVDPRCQFIVTGR